MVYYWWRFHTCTKQNKLVGKIVNFISWHADSLKKTKWSGFILFTNMKDQAIWHIVILLFRYLGCRSDNLLLSRIKCPDYLFPWKVIENHCENITFVRRNTLMDVLLYNIVRKTFEKHHFSYTASALLAMANHVTNEIKKIGKIVPIISRFQSFWR